MLNMNRKRLIAYTTDYVSFLLDDLSDKELSNIKNIILFGSVARGDFGELSDIDVFIDVIGKTERIKKSIENITKRFFDSSRFNEYWKLMGVDNNIKPIVGELNSWKDLRENIILNGITLYGKFKELPKRTNPMILFQWNSIKNDSKRVLLNKRLFGYKQYGKEYYGLVETIDGEKIGANCILIPIEHYKKVLGIFRKMKVSIKMREVLT